MNSVMSGGGGKSSASNSKGIELWRQARDLLQDVNATTTPLYLVKCFAALEQAKYHCKDGKHIEIHIKAINVVLSRLEMRLRRDPFETLGLEYNTKSSHARKAYYKLAKVYHPDKLGIPGMIFVIITEAYNTLSDSSTWKSAHSRLSHKTREPFLFKWGEAMSEARGESSSSSSTSATSKRTSSQRARPKTSYQSRYHRSSSGSSSSSSNSSNRSYNTYESKQASKRAAYIALSASRRARKAHRIALMHLRNARDNAKRFARYDAKDAARRAREMYRKEAEEREKGRRERVEREKRAEVRRSREREKERKREAENRQTEQFKVFSV